MKTAIVVSGFEGSGSVFISKTVSHVIAATPFGEWSGYGFNRQMGEDNIVLHRSIPYMRPKLWHDDPTELRELFAAYDRLRFIVTTRDLSASVASRMSRFGGTVEEYQNDNSRAAQFFQKLLAQEDCFIWSYETMCALRESYFRRLYGWLGVESNFIPVIEDANQRFFSRGFSE
ncbi:hypothetical protein [Yoonia sp.]|uniref:hypothetical protein n=1 Tax=Yoonia sp. TaxID=2212373 RepID=UPI00358FA928